MQGLNVIWVFNPTADKVLMCKRRKEPYKGLYNLVGGKIEPGEDSLSAAYRELHEETNITSDDISIVHLMDFTYIAHPFNSTYFNAGDCRVEVYVGTLECNVNVYGDENDLVWLDVTENFFDMTNFAGEGNIGHIYEIIKRRKLNVNKYDLNLFMMCDKLNESAFSDMPNGYSIRYLRENELDLWKRIHFDDDETADKYFGYMTEWFNRVYAPKSNLFFKTCLVAADGNDVPVGTCFTWKLADKFTTVHWYKVVKSHEGQGIGRALLSAAMRKLSDEDFPVFLHTQTGSFKAIKLYSDFGFKLLKDKTIGQRPNDLEQGLPILKKAMPYKYFNDLKQRNAPQDFLDFSAEHKSNDF